MYQQIPATPAQWFRLGSRTSAILTLAIGLSVMVGWGLDVTVLKRVFPDLPDMGPLMAVCMVLGGGALLLSNYRVLKTAFVCNAVGGFYVVFGVIWLLDFMGYAIPGLSGLIFPERDLTLAMGKQVVVAPATAANLALLGAALLMQNRDSPWGHWPAQLLLGAVAGSALVAGLGYLYGARTLYEFGPHFVPMAVHTALGFLLLAIGYLFLHPERGMMAVIANTAGSGLTTRRLVLGGIIIPLCLGWFTWKGQQHGWFLPLLSVVVLAVQTMFGFLALILWNGASLRRLEEEKARHELEIRDSEERFRLLAESAFEGILVTQEGNIVDANRRFCQMTGYDLHEVVGRRETEFFLSLDTRQPVDLIQQSGTEVEQGWVVRKGGDRFEIELESSTIPFQGNKAVVAAIRDITERREVDRLKDEFVSVVSHELRTPLTSVHGALGLVLGGVAGEVPEKIAAMLELARRNSNRLLLLINDILDMQKIESGALHFKKEVVEISTLARQVLESNEAFAAGHGVQLVSHQVQEGLQVLGDADRITQVLTNLISNACKFSHQGGRVELEVLQREQFVRVLVRDFGTGIASEFHERIFQKFAQADSSDTRSKGGTGLGLSISRALVEKMGGTIGFGSAPGHGSTFYFDLPLHAVMDVALQDGVDRVRIFAV